MYDVRRTYLSVYAICWMELNGFAVNANANFASRECALHIRSVSWAKSKCLTREEIEIERRGMAKLCVCVCVLCLICKICCSRNRKYSQIPYVGRAKAIQFRINWNPENWKFYQLIVSHCSLCVSTHQNIIGNGLRYNHVLGRQRGRPTKGTVRVSFDCGRQARVAIQLLNNQSDIGRFGCRVQWR